MGDQILFSGSKLIPKSLNHHKLHQTKDNLYFKVLQIAVPFILLFHDLYSIWFKTVSDWSKIWIYFRYQPAITWNKFSGKGETVEIEHLATLRRSECF